MRKKKNKKRTKNRYATLNNVVEVARKLYRLYGCGVHVGMKGGTMLVYWSLIRCRPDFSGRYYEDAFRAFLTDQPPSSCRKSEPTYPPAGVFVPGPCAANVPPAEEPKRDGWFSDPFLNSYEWRSLRLKILKKYGRRCMLCGATPDHGVRMNVDHIKPRKTHPELALEASNLQVLCEECNHGKGNWDSTDWRPPDGVLLS